jgi:addiction module HigA family antidote
MSGLCRGGQRHRRARQGRHEQRQIIREDVLAELGPSVGETTSRLGVSRVTLSRVLHGHARVTPNLAIRLEEAGVGTARAWLAMQIAFDLAAERAAGTPDVRKLIGAA